jgi:hypothetical protein
MFTVGVQTVTGGVGVSVGGSGVVVTGGSITGAGVMTSGGVTSPPRPTTGVDPPAGWVIAEPVRLLAAACGAGVELGAVFVVVLVFFVLFELLVVALSDVPAEVVPLVFPFS